MSHARRYHEPGVGSRTGMRIADGAFDLDDFFQAGRRALVGRSSTRKSTVSRSSLMSAQSDPSPRKSIARLSGEALTTARSPVDRVRQGMRVSSDPFAAATAGVSSSSVKENGKSSYAQRLSALKSGAPRRSVLAVVDLNSTSDATGPSSPSVWAAQGSSVRKNRPELNQGLEARRTARLGKIQHRQQKGRFRGPSSAHEDDRTEQTLRGDELSFSTIGRRSVAADRHDEEGDGDEDDDEDDDEEQAQNVNGTEASKDKRDTSVGRRSNVSVRSSHEQSRRSSSRFVEGNQSFGTEPLHVDEERGAQDSDEGSDMSIDNADIVDNIDGESEQGGEDVTNDRDSYSDDQAGDERYAYSDIEEMAARGEIEDMPLSGGLPYDDNDGISIAHSDTVVSMEEQEQEEQEEEEDVTEQEEGYLHDDVDTIVAPSDHREASRASTSSARAHTPQSDGVAEQATPVIVRQKAKRQKGANTVANVQRITARDRDDRSKEHDGVRRGARYRYAPLEYWRGERARFGRPSLPKATESGANGDDTIDADAFEDQVLPAPPPVAVLKEIIRIPRAKGEGTFSGLKLPSARPQGEEVSDLKRKRGGKTGSSDKIDPTKPTRNAEDGWDTDTATHADVLDAATEEIVNKQVACTSEQLRPRMAVGCSFGFEKVFVIEDFMATGMLFLLVDGSKPKKNSKDNYYTFTVLEGCVRVRIHEAEFIVAPQGMFFVPRGNDYTITNIAKRVARLAFTQAKRPTAQSQVLSSSDR